MALALAQRSPKQGLDTPYLVMVALYLLLTALASVAAGVTNIGLLEWFSGLRWLRAHFITLGVLLEVVFGVLTSSDIPNSEQNVFRWDIWIALNGGLISLLIGIPLINTTLLITGGALIFIATTMLIHRLAAPPHFATGQGFYLAGLIYLLLGIILGSGMWLGWGEWLRIPDVKEIHVHTNLWGFAALTFAGLWIDFIPQLTGKPLTWPYSRMPVFWLLVLGALGLVVGPWLTLKPVTTTGLILHTIGSVWLLATAIKSLAGRHRTPRTWLLTTSYVWFFIPVVIAPLIVAKAGNFPVAEVAQNGGPILIYGWLLQFVLGLLPLLVDLEEEGSWLSLGALHSGAVLYWLGLLIFPGYQMVLHSLAFLLWAVSTVPTTASIWRVLKHRQLATDQLPNGA